MEQHRSEQEGIIIKLSDYPDDIPHGYIPNEDYVFGKAAVCPQCNRIEVFWAKNGIPGKGCVNMDRNQFKYFYGTKYKGVYHGALPYKQCVNFTCRKKSKKTRFEHFKNGDLVDVKGTTWAEWQSGYEIDECVSDIDSYDAEYSVINLNDPERKVEIYYLGLIRLSMGT